MQMREWERVEAGMDGLWNLGLAAVYQKCRAREANGILNVLVLWRNCVTGFDGWKYRKRIGMQLQIKWICFECMKCICMELCTKWGIHSPNLTRRIAFLHWCTQYGHWDWIRACASAICGNCCTAKMWDWCGEHIAQHLRCWTSLPHWNAHAMKHETCPSTRRVWLVQAVGN